MIIKITYIAVAAILVSVNPPVHAEESVADQPKRRSYAERINQRRASVNTTSKRAVDILILLREGKQKEFIERLEQETDRTVLSMWQRFQSTEGRTQETAMEYLRKVKRYRTEHPAGRSGDHAEEAKRILGEISSTDPVEQPPERDK